MNGSSPPGKVSIGTSAPSGTFLYSGRGSNVKLRDNTARGKGASVVGTILLIMINRLNPINRPAVMPQNNKIIEIPVEDKIYIKNIYIENQLINIFASSSISF